MTVLSKLFSIVWFKPVRNGIGGWWTSCTCASRGFHQWVSEGRSCWDEWHRDGGEHKVRPRFGILVVLVPCVRHCVASVQRLFSLYSRACVFCRRRDVSVVSRRCTKRNNEWTKSEESEILEIGGATERKERERRRWGDQYSSAFCYMFNPSRSSEHWQCGSALWQWYRERAGPCTCVLLCQRNRQRNRERAIKIVSTMEHWKKNCDATC